MWEDEQERTPDSWATAGERPQWPKPLISPGFRNMFRLLEWPV